MTRKRCFSARIWCSHMRLPQAKPCSSTTGGPSPATLTEMFRSPTSILSMALSRRVQTRNAGDMSENRANDKARDVQQPDSLGGDGAEKGRDLAAQPFSRFFYLLG